MTHLITMPEVLSGADEATIAAWTVAEGDPVEIGATIAEVETEKALVDLPSQVAGTVGRLLVEAGQRVAVGTPLMVLLAPGEEIDRVDVSAAATPAVVTEEPAAAAPPTGVAAASTSTETGAAVPAGSRIFSSPLARKIAREHGADVSEISGTGPGGRVTRRDVERHVAAERQATATSASPSGGAALPPTAPATTALPTTPPPHASETVVPHSRMRAAIARRLTESKATVPHFYLRADCQVDALLELRRRINAVAEDRVSVNDLVVKAVARALVRVPEANVRWSVDGTVHLAGVDVAVAVSTGDGLLTPVVRAVDSRPVSAVSSDVRDLATRARSSSLRQHELEGGTMTVTNLGMHGVAEFAAIINPPQCAILAVGAASSRAVVVDGAVVPATVMTVTLAADHRVLDGELAARWLAAFVETIEAPVSLLV